MAEEQEEGLDAHKLHTTTTTATTTHLLAQFSF